MRKGVVCSSRCPSDRLSSGLAALLLTLLLVHDGYGLAVALIAWYWDVHLCNGRVAITGEISLSGHLGAVLGLREKALAACHKLAGTGIDANRKTVQSFGSLIIPIDNCVDGAVMEPLSPIDGSANRKVRRAYNHIEAGFNATYRAACPSIQLRVKPLAVT